MMISSGSITILNANLATGTATAGSTVGLNANGPQGTTAVYSPTKDLRTLMCSITGTWTGSIILQTTLDGVNWQNAVTVATATGTSALPITVNGMYTATITGAQQIRMTANGAMTGTAALVVGAAGDY